MPDPGTPGEAEDITHRALEPRPRPPTPRWVIVLGLIVVALLVVFVVSRLAGVEHGPGLHASLGVAAAGALSAVAVPVG